MPSPPAVPNVRVAVAARGGVRRDLDIPAGGPQRRQGQRQISWQECGVRRTAHPGTQGVRDGRTGMPRSDRCVEAAAPGALTGMCCRPRRSSPRWP